MLMKEEGVGTGKTGQEVIFFQGIMMIHIFDKIQIFEVIYATENLVEILCLPESSSVSGSALSGAISTN